LKKPEGICKRRRFDFTRSDKTWLLRIQIIHMHYAPGCNNPERSATFGIEVSENCYFFSLPSFSPFFSPFFLPFFSSFFLPFFLPSSFLAMSLSPFSN